jgi:hypothetical protein
MTTPRLFFQTLRCVPFALLGLTFASAQSTPAFTPVDDTPWWNMGSLVDRLPQFLADRLPDYDPSGTTRVYVRPHVGDFVHPDSARVPLGAWVKVTDRIECNVEFESYYAPGRENVNAAGFSSMNFGVKADHILPSFDDTDFSLGLNYRTPFNRSPWEYSDGYRHLQPYIAATRPILPAWQLLGYGSFGANFIEHTALRSNFGRNQLHGNSLAITAGIARDWGRFHASLTARMASTAFTSGEGRQNFSLRPELIIPLRRNPAARTQIFLTLGGRAIWGPDGFDSGTSSSLRFQFNLDRHRAADRARETLPKT